MASLPDIHNGAGIDNPVRGLAKVLGYMSAVLNDPEVLDASDQFFGAMKRASDRYEYQLQAAPTPALDRGTNDDH